MEGASTYPRGCEVNFDIRTEQLGDDAYVISLAGEVDLYTAPEFKQQLLEVIGQDYVRTARAKGLLPGTIIVGHTLKNALLPIVTLVGLEFASVLGGAVLTETMFSWPAPGTCSRWPFCAPTTRSSRAWSC